MDKMCKNIVTPDYLSFTTQHLHFGIFETGCVVASGTGFVYKTPNGCFYLVTCWHNVTGKHPISKECLGHMAAIPDVIVTYFRSRAVRGQSHKEILSLYADELKTCPLWLEHPIYKEKTDIVAIPIKNEIALKYNLSPINNYPFDVDFEAEVSDEVFIIGYPFSKSQYLHMPIWKKGSIATEPTINIDQLPKMYIDTATRPGLSGSPVIFQRTGIHNLDKSGNCSDSTIIGRIRGFIGVYSGRIGDDELKAQLGIVWKKKVIDEILQQCI